MNISATLDSFEILKKREEQNLKTYNFWFRRKSIQPSSLSFKKF